MFYNVETADAPMMRRHVKALGLEVVAERAADAAHAVDGQSPQTLFILQGRMVNKVVLELLCIAHGQQCLAMYNPDSGIGVCIGPKPWPFDVRFFAFE